MKEILHYRSLAMGAWLILGICTGASAQQAPSEMNPALRQQELQARGRVEAQLSALRHAEATSASNVGELRNSLAQAEAGYRRAVSARVIAESSTGDRAGVLVAQQQDLAKRENQMRGIVSTYLNGRIGSTDSASKTNVMAGAEATLRTLRMEQEIVNEAARQIQPLAEQNGRSVNTTTQRMNDLLSRISTTDTNESSENRTPIQHEVEMWMRDRQRQMDVEEYQRLARNAQMISPTTGQAITGIQRERIALDAEKQLSESLAYHAREKTPFWDWWNGTTDSRRDLANQIKSNVEAAPEYKALSFLAPTEDSTRMHYLALATAIGQKQSQMDQWYTNEYLGQTEADGQRSAAGNAVHAWWSTGFGTLARANDLSWGGADNTSVEEKMQAIRRETDAAMNAFKTAAATPNPADLPTAQRELLQRFGYIQSGPNNKLSYTLPQGRQQLGGLTQTDLPGASVFDNINMETIAVTAASVALPELAAARASNLALKLGATANVAMRTGQVASIATGMAVDAGMQYATTGEVNAQRLLVDNLLVGSLAGKAGDMAAAGGSRLASLLKAEGKGGALAKSVEKAVAQTLGLTTENALQAAYQSTVAAGHPDLKYEDFLANMMTGVMGRTMASAHPGAALDHALQPGFDAVLSRLPEGKLKETLMRDPALMLEEKHRVQAEAEGNRATWERFMEVTNNGKNVDAETLGAAMQRGDFSWSDLKTVAAESPDQLGPVQASINEARVAFYESVNQEAIATAHRELDSEYQTQIAALDQSGLPPEQVAAQKQKLNDWWADEKQRIHEGELNAGSIGVTSDIDRSWMSQRVRDAAKKIEDRELARRAGDLPGPSSARAFDLNEYYNVMPFIGETYGNSMAKLDNLPGAHVESKNVDLTHGQTMEAAGLASAMMHMDQGQRAQYQENKLAAASPDKRPQLEAQFAWANENLADQKRIIDERARQIAEERSKAGESIAYDDPDIQLRARDQVYGERMTELIGIEQQLKTMDPASPEAQKLRAEWERKMSVGLREGIEAYTQPAGLALIVSEWQSKKITDPVTGKSRKRTVEELMTSPDFKLEGELGQKYNSGQIDGMFNDQVMFMMEHMNGYRTGHESAETAARALGKYGERALLAMSIQGNEILKPDHPLRELYDTTQKLMAVKDDPVATRQLLATLDPEYNPNTKTGDPDKGMRQLLQQMEKLPGMEGMATATQTLDPASMRMANQAARRRLERERAAARETGGPEAEFAFLQRESQSMDEEISRLKKQTQKQEDLDARFLRKDQTEAQKLEAEKAALEERLALLPGGAQNHTDTAKELRAEIEKRDHRLAELNENYAAAGSPQDQSNGELNATKDRLAQLEKSREELEGLSQDAREKADEAQRSREAKAILAAEEAPSQLGTEKSASAETEPESRSDAKSLTDELATRPADGLPIPPPNRPKFQGHDRGGPQSARGGGIELKIPHARFRIGESLQIQFTTPEDPAWKIPTLKLMDRSGDARGFASISQRGSGTASIILPATFCDLQLQAVTDDNQILCTLPLSVMVTPVPGALTVTGSGTYPIASKIRVNIQTPAGLYQHYPRIGLYFLDGPSRKDPAMVAQVNLKDLNTPAEIVLPNYSGHFELRLFDRDESYYVLDTLPIQTVVTRASGAMKIAKRHYAIGEPVEVEYDIPEDVFLDRWAWIGLYDITTGVPETVIQPSRPSFVHTNGRHGKMTFNPPTIKGTYLLRLYDREHNPILLDVKGFATHVRGAAGALKIQQPTVNLGQPIQVQLAIPENVHLDSWAYVSTHLMNSRTSRGERAPRLESQNVPKDGRNAVLTFTAPNYPAELEVRLYDREHNGYLLDTTTVNVQVQPVPGSIKLPKTQFTLGEVIPIQVALPDNVKLFSWSNVALHPVPGPGTDFRASVSNKIESAYIDDKKRTATLHAPSAEGTYEVRLMDRESSFYCLDRIQVEVVATPTPNALSLPGGTAVAGTTLEIGYNIPEGIFLGSYPHVRIIRPAFVTPGGALTNDWFGNKADLDKNRSGNVKLNLPSEPGRYEIRLYDRADKGYILDRKYLNLTPKMKENP